MKLRTVNKAMFPIVEKAYDAIRMIDDLTHARPLRVVTECAEKEERHHRSGSLYTSGFAASHPNAATIKLCARMFVVKWIADELEKISKGSASDVSIVITCREDVYRCAAIAQYYEKHLRKAWAEFDIASLAHLDYVDFVGRAEKPNHE